MLTVHHLSKSFAHQQLLEDVSFTLNLGERVGLIGPNGCGKTTLLRILAGEESADAGHVERLDGLRIGYLRQALDVDPAITIADAIHREADDIFALEDALAAAAAELIRSPQDARWQAHYDDLLNRVQTAETSRSRALLAGLGLDVLALDTPVGNLSGGQKTRLSLALVLLDDPQLLLLDEPTNHLDIAMLEWLESWLEDCGCAALIVSHDRRFLDRTVSRIIAIDPRLHSAQVYTGNYSAYVEQRQAEIERQWTEYKDQQMEIHRMEQDIARIKAQAMYTERQTSSVRIGGREMKAKGVKDYHRSIAKKVAKKAISRERKLERYLDSEERVEKPGRERAIQVRFHESPHIGKFALVLDQLSAGYSPNHPLLEGVSLEARTGRRIAISGPNGQGKTTLLRTIAGQIPALAGKIHLATSTHLGSMTQDQSGVEHERSALEIILSGAGQQAANTGPSIHNETQARSFLAAFLLTGNEALKPVRLLSYGQRARLMLAQLVAAGCNCLLLDEPINHLDIPSREQFEQALDTFSGTALVVIHDRYFIERFADEIWWVAGGGIRREFRRIDDL